MLALYVHIPFCVRKCLYCGFYSTAYRASVADDYLSALGLEAARLEEKLKHRQIRSIYIGGGTPTVLNAAQMSRVFSALQKNFTISENAEFTVEANPGTLSKEKLRLLYKSGVNRLSIGAQSFSDAVLKRLGRVHNAQEAADAVRLARTAGFRNISIDLIYGTPGQSAAEWKESLDRAIDLAPEHVSAYALSFDEGSIFFQQLRSGRLVPLDDDKVGEMYETAVEALSRAGYEHYEVSNFSLPGFSCRHNMNYWERGEYLGLGAGAWSFISGKRHSALADVGAYCVRMNAGESVIEHVDHPDAGQAAAEWLMLGLRTRRGVDMNRFREAYLPDDRERIARRIAMLRHGGLVRLSGGRLRLTDRGMFLSDEVLLRLSR